MSKKARRISEKKEARRGGVDQNPDYGWKMFSQLFLGVDGRGDCSILQFFSHPNLVE